MRIRNINAYLRVAVTVFNYCRAQINKLGIFCTIVEKAVYKTEEVPYPLIRTKGIVRKAGFFAKSKVKSHNAQIERSPYPPIDISIADVQTRNGKVTYCTCARERELFRTLEAINNHPYVLIENYPVSKESDIPYEARKELQRRMKNLRDWEKQRSLAFEQERKQRDLELERDIEFEEDMEDLDQYN